MNPKSKGFLFQIQIFSIIGTNVKLVCVVQKIVLLIKKTFLDNPKFGEWKQLSKTQFHSLIVSFLSVVYKVHY